MLTVASFSSYPAWSSTGQLPMPAPVGAGGYPPTTLSAEPYPKLPLSGAPSYTAEPQDMLQTTSMAPPVQLSLVPSSTPGDDQQHQQHQPPAIRTQYAYVPAPPPTASTGGAGSAQSSASHLGPLSSGSATSPALPTHGSDNSSTSLGVPRYVVDSGVPPRGPGVKSPRGTVGGHSGHSSVHSTGSSVPTAEQSPEYRYGPPSYASAPPSAVPATESSTNAASATASGGPTPRDYFPQNTWTTTAGEAPAPTVAYTNGTSAASTDGRPYGFPDQYKTGPGLASIKNEPHSHHTNTTAPGQGVFAAAPRNSFDAINHYQWGAT